MGHSRLQPGHTATGINQLGGELIGAGPGKGGRKVGFFHKCFNVGWGFFLFVCQYQTSY